MTRYRAKLIMKDGTFLDLPYDWNTLGQAYTSVGHWVAPTTTSAETQRLVTDNIVGFQVYAEHSH